MRKKNQGYALLIVMVLLVIGTVMLIMFNRESLFFTKVTAFFTRSRKIQSQAADGIELAKSDFRILTKNSKEGTPGADTFAVLANGSAVDQGLKYDSAGTRVLTPRRTRRNGDYLLEVYYFPENPCISATACSTDDAYNQVLPKRFVVISQATNTSNGEIFTSESRIQATLENYAEISFALTGVKCVAPGGGCSTGSNYNVPAGNTPYPVSPATYNGPSYFNMPANLLKFVLDSGAVQDQSQQHIFKDLATFSATTPAGTPPFTTTQWQVNQQQADGSSLPLNGQFIKPMMTFAKGYEEGKTLIDPTDDSTNPASDTYFSSMKAIANTPGQGYNLSAGLSCPASANGFGKKQVDVCLKFEKDKIKQYTCKKYASDFMGRIDTNLNPAAAYSATGTTGYTQSNAGIFKPGTGQEDTFPDRYVGEHAEVYTGTPAPGSTVLGNTNGVIFCDMGSGCSCNVHIKGIVEGNVNVVAQNVVIEGDLRYQHQGDGSVDTLGVIAKNQIVIPAGIPQAATSISDPNLNSGQDAITTVDYEAPYTTTSQSAHRPGNLAESYLNITNFIPYDTATSQYVDRNATDTTYHDVTRWNLSATNNKQVSSPTSLDMDGYFYAGDTLKVDGIWNPLDKTTPSPGGTSDEKDNSGANWRTLTFIVCEDPPLCNNYSYRTPEVKSDTDPKSLYKMDGTLADSTLSPGTPVQPLFWVNGLDTSKMAIAESYNYANTTAHANYDNVAFQPGEEVALPGNRAINVFGSMNTKFNYIYDKMSSPGPTAGTAYSFKMGFKRKLITKNSSAPFLPPPGFPATGIVKIDELYTKNVQGKSAFLP